MIINKEVLASHPIKVVAYCLLAHKVLQHDMASFSSHVFHTRAHKYINQSSYAHMNLNDWPRFTLIDIAIRYREMEEDKKNDVDDYRFWLIGSYTTLCDMLIEMDPKAYQA